MGTETQEALRERLIPEAHNYDLFDTQTCNCGRMPPTKGKKAGKKKEKGKEKEKAKDAADGEKIFSLPTRDPVQAQEGQEGFKTQDATELRRQVQRAYREALANEGKCSSCQHHAKDCHSVDQSTDGRCM